MQQQPSSAQIAGMILSAPVWARLALAVRDPRARERGAEVIAARIVDGLDDDLDNGLEPDPRQLMLPIGG